MTACLVCELNMLRSLKALYAYTDIFLAIFSLVDASSRLNPKRLDRERQTETDRDGDRHTHRHTDTQTDTQKVTDADRDIELEKL